MTNRQIDNTCKIWIIHLIDRIKNLCTCANEQMYNETFTYNLVYWFYFKLKMSVSV